MLIASGPHCRATCSAPHIQQYYFCLIECRSVSTTSTFKNAEEIPSLCRSHSMVYARSFVEKLIHIQLIIKFSITKHVGLPRLFVGVVFKLLICISQHLIQNLTFATCMIYISNSKLTVECSRSNGSWGNRMYFKSLSCFLYLLLLAESSMFSFEIFSIYQGLNCC